MASQFNLLYKLQFHSKLETLKSTLYLLLINFILCSMVAETVDISIGSDINVDSAGIALVGAAVSFSIGGRSNIAAIAPGAPRAHLTVATSCCRRWWSCCGCCWEWWCSGLPVSASDGELGVGVPVVDGGPLPSPDVHVPYRGYLIWAVHSLIIVYHAAHVLSQDAIYVPPIIARDPTTQEVYVVLSVVLGVDCPASLLPGQTVHSQSGPLVVYGGLPTLHPYL